MESRWKRVEELFHQAADLALADRSAFLDRSCEGDPDLRSQLEALLAADARDNGSLEAAVVNAAQQVPAANSKETVTAPADRIGWRRRWPAILMAAAGLSLVCWVAAQCIIDVVSLGAHAWPGFRFNKSSDIGSVTAVFPGTAASDAGLRAGDLVIAIDGLRLRERGDGPYWRWNSQLLTKSLAALPGQTVVYRVIRGEDTFDVPVRLMHPARNLFFGSSLVSTTLTIVVFVTVGTFVLWRKPVDERARVFFLLCIAVGCGLAEYPLEFWQTDSLGAVEPNPWPHRPLTNILVLALLGFWTSSLMLHLALCFPKPRPILMKYPKLRYIIHSLPLLIGFVPLIAFFFATVPKVSVLLRTRVVLALLGMLFAVALFKSVRLAKSRSWRGLLEQPFWPTLLLVSGLSSAPIALHGVFPHTDVQVRTVYFLLAFFSPSVCVTSGFITAGVVLIRTYRSGALEERKQIQWPAWSIASFALVQEIGPLIAVLRGMKIIPTTFSVPVVLGAVLLNLCVAALVPLSIAVAILRYRLLDIEVFIRRTIVYGLLTGVVLTGYLVMAGGLGGFLVRVTSVRSEWVAIGSTLAIAALLAPAKTRLQTYVDDRFFGRSNTHSSVSARLNESMLQAQSVKDSLIVAIEIMQREFGVAPSFCFSDELQQWTTASKLRSEQEKELHSFSLILPRLEPTLIRVTNAGLVQRTADELRKARCDFLLPVSRCDDDRLPGSWP